MDYSFRETEWIRYDGGRHPISRVSTDIRVRAIRDFTDEVRDATRRAAEIAQATAIELAPEGGPHNPSDKSRKHLKDAIEIAKESVDVPGRRSKTVTSAIFAPGGSGGGGNFQQRIFVNTYDAPHAAYLFTGTGIFGPKAARIQYGKEIRFFWWRAKKPMRVDSIAGMEPNTDWWEKAHLAMALDLNTSLKRIRAQGVSNANS